MMKDVHETYLKMVSNIPWIMYVWGAAINIYYTDKLLSHGDVDSTLEWNRKLWINVHYFVVDDTMK